jgi:anthranilate synthase component 2
MATKIVMLDNLDSFTYNLVDEFQQLDCDLVVYRNTLSADYIIKQIEHFKANGEQVLLVLSPGPGAPAEAGCLMALIAKALGKLPILGICLGHQALVEHFGGTVDRAPEIVHGKASLIEHNQQGPFAGFKSPMSVARYHSLVATKMPQSLTLIAHYQQMPMAIMNEQQAVLGFQFHPESILSCQGSQLLQQSIEFLLAQNQFEQSNKEISHGQ